MVETLHAGCLASAWPVLHKAVAAFYAAPAHASAALRPSLAAAVGGTTRSQARDVTRALAHQGTAASFPDAFAPYSPITGTAGTFLRAALTRPIKKTTRQERGTY